MITLCAEEVCPIFLGATTRLHWALPDPAAVQGSADEQLRAFSDAADALSRRLEQFVSSVE